jgi:CubicO group peptidase (beta-lactamase class C family)
MPADLSPVAHPGQLGVSAAKLGRAAAILDEWVLDDVVPGVAAIVTRRGQSVLEHYAGTASPGDGAPPRPVSRDTVFFASSLAKTVVAMAAMTLIESGHLLLDDRVGEIVPEFSRLGKERVSVYHLLVHTSGLPDQLPNNDALRKAHSALASFVRSATRCELAFTAGTRLQYSNVGYLMLGEICQRLTNETLVDQAQRAVLRPLGMTRSGFAPDHLLYPEIARVRMPAVRKANNWDVNSDYWRQLAAPWAGLYSTAGDLAVLGQFFLDACVPNATSWTTELGTVLSPGTLRLMIRNHTAGLPAAQGPGEAWGIGWVLRSGGTGGWAGALGSRDLFGHVGGSGCMVWVDPSSQIVCVVLTNQTTDWAIDWRRFARFSNAVHASVVT